MVWASSTLHTRDWVLQNSTQPRIPCGPLRLLPRGSDPLLHASSLPSASSTPRTEVRLSGAAAAETQRLHVRITAFSHPCSQDPGQGQMDDDGVDGPVSHLYPPWLSFSSPSRASRVGQVTATGLPSRQPRRSPRGPLRRWLVRGERREKLPHGIPEVV